jgi:hypothetical protein
MKFNHIDGVSVAARFSEEDGKRYRYRLEAIKIDVPSTGETICLVMQNPSYADKTVADRSVKRMEEMIFGNKQPAFKQIRRLIVVNQFALVQTSGFQGNDEDIGKDNDKEIGKALRESEIVVLGWGASNRFDARKCFIIGLLKQMPGKKIYKTKVHPSRGSFSNDFIQVFNL